eukprot:TRINITY_DN1000_c0_g1_i5.p1 TRINITY_DN1000_c0_g1~~TRINITY_DN1000_c0_g1_i5.p1  ORF type:complete len:702 (-),score=128.96 TRINITY_DN1000_c0_g1_i5:195-2219(-)
MASFLAPRLQFLLLAWTILVNFASATSVFNFRKVGWNWLNEAEGNVAALSGTYPSGHPLSYLWEDNGGNCTSTVVNISATKAKHIFSRVSYSGNQTVVIHIMKNITLRQNLIFGANFSCTIFIGKRMPGGQNPTIKMHHKVGNDIFFKMWETNNVIITGVDLRMPKLAHNATCPSAKEYYTASPCPAIHMYKSFGIQITQANIFGRIDVVRTPIVTLDSLNVTYVGTSLIRIQFSGLVQDLISGDINVTNNFVTSGIGSGISYDGAIYVDFYSMGVTVANNHVNDYHYAGLKCGCCVSWVADCIYNTFEHNYVYKPSNSIRTGDDSGIYFGGHWVNVGNVATCNYVIGGTHCLYLDFQSAGLLLDGGVCYGMQDGIKVNVAKSDVLRSYLMVNVNVWDLHISSATWETVNCNTDLGQKWLISEQTIFDSPETLKEWPFLATLCTETSVYGNPCNPPGFVDPSVSGNCSGLPTRNDYQVIVANQNRTAKMLYFADMDILLDMLPGLNKVDVEEVNFDDVGFTNFIGGEFGGDMSVADDSPIYNIFPDFRSCPLSDVGPKQKTMLIESTADDVTGQLADDVTGQLAEHLRKFNVGRPDWFDRLVNGPVRLHMSDILYAVRSGNCEREREKWVGILRWALANQHELTAEDLELVPEAEAALTLAMATGSEGTSVFTA